MNYESMKVISITELRRNFGQVTENLTELDALLLTKGGEPFAILKSAPEEKMKILKKSAGAWKRTALDSDHFWKKVSLKKSRAAAVHL